MRCTSASTLVCRSGATWVVMRRSTPTTRPSDSSASPHATHGATSSPERHDQRSRSSLSATRPPTLVRHAPHKSASCSRRTRTPYGNIRRRFRRAPPRSRSGIRRSRPFPWAFPSHRNRLAVRCAYCRGRCSSACFRRTRSTGTYRNALGEPLNTWFRTRVPDHRMLPGVKIEVVRVAALELARAQPPRGSGVGVVQGAPYNLSKVAEG